MPARTTVATATATAKPVTKSTKRFELPALEFKFDSLTDGTDIPPPLPSPVNEVPTPPQTPPPVETDKEKGLNGNEKTNGATNGHDVTTKSATAGVKRPADESPLSPALSSRQGSIRRLFSRSLLNNAYADGEPEGMNGGRPSSQSGGSLTDDKKAKRGSGWFRRLRSSETTTKRSSALYEESKKSAGPPPPMIPELTDLEANVDVKDEGSLGSDLFKNIK
jgi:hypothetical protein